MATPDDSVSGNEKPVPLGRILSNASSILNRLFSKRPESQLEVGEFRQNIPHRSNTLNLGFSSLSLNEQDQRLTETIGVELIRGWGDVPVVGESFYEHSFKQLHRRLLKNPDGQFLQWAEVVTNPRNPHSKSGKAVEVYVDGLQVGHIAEKLAPIVFDALEYLGGRAAVQARVHLDTTSGGFRWSSVELHMAIPPTPTTNTSNHKIDSVMYGPKFLPIGLFHTNSNAGTLIQNLSVGEVLIAGVNLKFQGSSVSVCTVEGVEFLNNVELEISPEHPFFALPSLPYVTAKIRRCENGFHVGLQISEDQKIVKVRTGNAVSPAGNQLSSKHHLGLTPSGNWTVIRRIPFASAASDFKIPLEFEARESQPLVYFWAQLDSRYGTFMTPWGFRGALYRKTEISIRKQLDSLPDFVTLVRGIYDPESKKVIFEADLDLNADLILLPQRPIEPQSALNGRQPRVVNSLPKARKIKEQTPAPVPKFDIYSERLDILSRKLSASGLDHLEDTYLYPCLKELFTNHEASGAKKWLLVGGNRFDIGQSSAAKDAARRGIPIVPTSRLRAMLADDLVAFPRYRALTRYEDWFESLGVANYGSWGFTLQTLDLRNVDVLLIPGAALDERSLIESMSFSAELVGSSESKAGLSRLFTELGGGVLDTILVRAKLRFFSGNEGLAVKVYKGELFLGRAPANESNSLAESARLYKLDEVWVRIDWTSKARFKSAFTFVGND